MKRISHDGGKSSKMTISEIAKMADVSVSAVSRYMNNGYVSKEKKERIQKVIESTGYVPSAHAQILRTKKTKVIGVVIPKIDSESISQMVSGISGELSEAGYQLLLASTWNNPVNEIEYLKTFSQNRVDGIIFIGTTMNQKHERLLKKMRIPVVLLGQREPYISCIFYDDYHAAKDLAALLAAGRHKKIGFLGATVEDKAVGRDRRQGFLDALAEAGIQADEKRMVCGDFTMNSGYEKAKLLMEQAPDTDALFCATDTMAVGAMRYFKETGKRIPDDISITGIGHTKLSEVVTPMLTTAHYQYETAGIEGARMLLEKLENPDVPDKQLMLGYEIIRQESVL